MITPQEQKQNSQQLFVQLLQCMKEYIFRHLGTIIDLQLLDEKSAAIYLRMSVKPIIGNKALLESKALEIDPRVGELEPEVKQRIMEYLEAMCSLL
jgi:hypothetical protein